MIDQAARARIDRWKQSLLDPDDRLLDLGDHGLELAIDPVRIAFALAAGSALTFEAATDAGFEAGRLRVPLPADDLASRVSELVRDSHAARAQAEHVLWLALGLVTWIDGTGTVRRSPLALWPVELVPAADGSQRLRACRDLRPRLNDMLLEGLRREHAIDLAMGPTFDLGALLGAATSAIWDHEAWRVDRTARLLTLSFASYDLWRDLEARGEDLYICVAASWLAGGLTPPALYAPASQDLLAPLDADAGQLAAVRAAGAGSSFVLQGPPGTGKSQTIANLAVHCASSGKTVLVVSDRASALDVVYQRLGSVGFGELCLPLHGGRKRALGTLARVFERTFKPVAASTPGDARLDDLRAALDDYASALHKIGPFGMSIHEGLGRLVELRTTPRAALSDRDAGALDRTTFLRRRGAVGALADAAAAVEPVASHPWRTSALDASSADGAARVKFALSDMASAIEALRTALADVGALVPNVVARTPDQLRALGALADLAAGSPRPGSEVLTSMRGARHDDIGEKVALIRARGGGTLEIPRDPGSFLAIALRQRALADEIEEVFTGAIDELDAPEVWSQLKRWTGSMAALRYMALRNARAAVRAAAQPGYLETDAAMISALEAVIAERACRTALLGAAEAAQRWFGELGGDPLSLELARIEDAVTWGGELRRAFDQVTISGGDSNRQAAWRALVAQVSASPRSGDDAAAEPSSLASKSSSELEPFARLAATILRWEPALAELATVSGIPAAVLGAGADHLATLRDQVTVLRDAVGSFTAWTRFHLARRAALSVGVGPAIGAIERGDLAAAELADAWERATLLSWLELEIAETSVLDDFNGAMHHANVTTFADLDRGSLAMTRAKVVARIADRMPRAKDSSDPELQLLREELAASEPRPLREVLSGLPTLLPRIAPIVLATPHTLAEHLDPAAPKFDVVVFDEASSLPVAHALGALARASSAIIVGDLLQLTPHGAEGLLELAVATKLPMLSLGAHYRSRHEDLFAFANRRYYGNAIEVLPAAQMTPEIGIAWRCIESAEDAAGGNRAEAEQIVAGVRARLADATQRTRTFAIVALTHAQQRLIEEALDRARVVDLALAAAMSAEGEYVLVGTPDRVQGEERDVVFVSVGDRATALQTLSQKGARRLLDVATTRAREHMTIVSSFVPEDIAADAPPAARDLADLLAFARARGGAARPADDAAPATPITAAIARALADRGWTLKHQVGCGPYTIDLAVVDPNDPERYVLAIEHDGSAYASSTSARSRDRLRAQLLTSLGWRVHRIWSIDWWIDAEREIARAHGAIVAAIAACRSRRTTLQPTPRPARGSIAPRPGRSSIRPRLTTPPAVAVATSLTGNDTIPTDAAVLASGSGPTDAASLTSLPEGSGPITPVRLPRGAIGIGPYTAAAVPAGRRAPDDMFAPRYAGELSKCIEQVLATEAPIHIDLLARRVGAYFGVGRVTPPVLELITGALEGRGKFGQEPNIVWRVDQDPSSVPAVRVAGQGMSARRDIAEVPLSEVAAAARIVVERANGVSTTDLVRDCARLLGFARITEQVSARVAIGVRLATVRELISIDDGKAHLMLE